MAKQNPSEQQIHLVEIEDVEHVDHVGDKLNQTCMDGQNNSMINLEETLGDNFSQLNFDSSVMKGASSNASEHRVNNKSGLAHPAGIQI